MRIAITGGIGSGKSYVSKLLADFGIVVYDCDDAAKRLIRTSPTLQASINETIGRDVFPSGQLDKTALSRYIVESEENTRKINSVVHPAVAEDFLKSGLEWLESAILFESGFYDRVKFDYIVCVSSPLELRISRLMSRDNLSREKVMEWIGRQMPQEEKVNRADFEIKNDGLTDLKSQIAELVNTVNKNYKYK